jgi:hypothetical protein
MRQNDDRCWANTFGGRTPSKTGCSGLLHAFGEPCLEKRRSRAKMTQRRRLNQPGMETAAIAFAERVHLVADLCNFKPSLEVLVLSIGLA